MRSRFRRVRPHFLPVLALLLVLPGCTQPDASGNPATAGLERAYAVTVFADTDVGQDRRFVAKVTQADRDVATRDFEAKAGFPFHTILFSPSVQKGPALVSVEEPTTGATAQKTVRPDQCASGEVAVTVTVRGEAAPAIASACN